MAKQSYYKILSERATKHGLHRNPIYGIWSRMKARCQNPNRAVYKYYGGRGIVVCHHWQSVQNFYEDMGPRPTPKHEIDRRDNDGGYWCGHCEECIANEWPANCHWATRSEQMNNTRRTTRVTFKGKRRTLAECADMTGLSPNMIQKRLKRGWSVARALSTPSATTSTQWQRGSAHFKAKITEADVLEIRRLGREEGLRGGDLIHRYPLKRSAIDHIQRYRSWKHVR